MFERLLIAVTLIGAASMQALATPAAPAPAPILGTGLSALVVAGVGVYAWYRGRKN